MKQSTRQHSGYTIPILTMFALFFMISFVTGLQNPMAIIVKSQFEASNFMSQLGNAANFIAYAFMGIPAGLLLQKIGYKRTALIAVVVGFGGVGIQYLSGVLGSFGIYLSGAFISGFSMCMLNTVVNPMLNTLGGGGKKGNQLIQLGSSVNSIGATIAPVLVGYLIGNTAQATISNASPALFLAMGIFVIAFIILKAVNIPEPHLATKEVTTEKDKYSVFSFRHFILGAIAIFVYEGIEVGVANITNLYITDDISEGGLGIDSIVAGSIIGTYWFLMLIGRLVGASLGAKISSRKMLSFVSVLGVCFVLLAIHLPQSVQINLPVFQSDISFGFVEIPINIMFLVLCGFCTSVMWGNIFNLAVEGLGKYTAAASGVFMTMVCGGGILPLVQGHIADISSYVTSYYMTLLCFIYILFYALIGSKNANKDILAD